MNEKVDSMSEVLTSDGQLAHIDAGKAHDDQVALLAKIEVHTEYTRKGIDEIRTTFKDEIFPRLRNLEQRQYWFSGAAAGAGLVLAKLWDWLTTKN